MSLDPETIKLMSQLFEGHECCKCGAPAKRVKGEDFYCHECYKIAVPRAPVYEKKVHKRPSLGR